MKRTSIFLILVMVGLCSLGFAAGWSRMELGTPVVDSGYRCANTISADACMEGKLPWDVVDAVLQWVESKTNYSYSELVGWYYDEVLTVEVIKDGYYQVTIYHEGRIEIITTDNLGF